jgi:SAM-dependent methyltransferase
MLKAQVDAWSNSPNPLFRALARTIHALGHVRRFIRNPRVRSENITRILYRGHHLQGATFSEPNRYPTLFAACANHLNEVTAPTILSFGCATGEEAFALAERLPNAMIIGVDINRWCLAQARKANCNPRIRFLHALSPEFVAYANFDAIFAMAVFQRSENRSRTASAAHASFPFAKFQQQIDQLDAHLKPGGLFFIDHADFRFEDTAAAAYYTPLNFEGSQITHDRPLFGSNNQLIAARYSALRAFQKNAP